MIFNLMMQRQVGLMDVVEQATIGGFEWCLCLCLPHHHLKSITNVTILIVFYCVNRKLFDGNG